MSGERKLPEASLSDGGFVLFGTCLWNITYSKWFLPDGAYPLAVSRYYLGMFPRHSDVGQ
jgi:hypothetical protein